MIQRRNLFILRLKGNILISHFARQRKGTKLFGNPGIFEHLKIKYFILLQSLNSLKLLFYFCREITAAGETFMESTGISEQSWAPTNKNLHR
jgi:hypothetical protein